MEEQRTSSSSFYLRRILINALSTAASTVLAHSLDTAKNRTICGDWQQEQLKNFDGFFAVDDNSLTYHVLHNVGQSVLELSLYMGIEIMFDKVTTLFSRPKPQTSHYDHMDDDDGEVLMMEHHHGSNKHFLTILKKCAIAVVSGTIAKSITHPLEVSKLQNSMTRFSSRVSRVVVDINQRYVNSEQQVTTRQIGNFIWNTYYNGLALSLKHYSIYVALSVLSFESISTLLRDNDHDGDDRDDRYSRQINNRDHRTSRQLQQQQQQQRQERGTDHTNDGTDSTIDERKSSLSTAQLLRRREWTRRQNSRDRNQFLWNTLLLMISKVIPEYALFPLEVNKIQQMGKMDMVVSKWLTSPRKIITPEDKSIGQLYSIMSNVVMVPVHYAFYSVLDRNLPYF